MLLDGLLMHGMGNWLAVSEYMGSRTKADVETHYHTYYINSSRWPEPVCIMDIHTLLILLINSIQDVPEDVPISSPDEMRAKKRRRIEYLTVNPPLPPAPVQNSGPTSHEIAGYMPGRLEFEHEVENDAEELIKDNEFGIVRAYGGDEQVQDPADVTRRLEAVKQRQEAAKTLPKMDPNGTLRNTPIDVKEEDDESKDGLPPIPDAIETRESINIKLALLHAYGDRLDKREHAKALLLDRGLLEARKVRLWSPFRR
jgi:transcriptional adapter 2-alpha